MPKVLIISEQLWPEGGGGTLATHLTIKLISQLHDMKIVVVSGTKHPVRVHGVEYIFTPLLQYSNKVKLWVSNLLLARQKWFIKLVKSIDVAYIPRYCYPLIPFIKKLKKKVVVHLHDYQPISHNAIILHEKYGEKIAEKPADIVQFEILEHSNTIRAILSVILLKLNGFSKLWISKADKIICVSKKQHEIFQSTMPNLANKIEVVYNPLPIMKQRVEKGLKDPAFLYLGGDSYVKGFHIFLAASYDVLKRHPNVRFLLAQKKDLRKKNLTLINRLNRKFGATYNLLGCLTHEELLKIHSISYALLFSSISEEPLPYVILESMLAGTMPIAPRLGGIPEIVLGTSAEKYLFEPNNIEDLISKIEMVLSLSKEQLLNDGIKLRESILKKIDSNIVKQKFADIFRTIA